MTKQMSPALLALALAFPSLVEAQSRVPISYTDDCVVAQVASITSSVTERQIQLRIDPIPRIAQRFNLSCLRNIVFSLGGFGALGFPNPFAQLGTAVCNAINGAIGG